MTLSESMRWFIALLMTLGWAALWLPYVRHCREKQGAGTRPTGQGNMPSLLICHASQSGNAEQLARQAADHLQHIDPDLQLLPLGQVTPQQLSTVSRLIIIASTYGDGEPPDSAIVFSSRVLNQRLQLEHMSYLLLGLGDRQYPHFCAFAERLDGWLKHQGAQAMAPWIGLDRLDQSGLSKWQLQLADIGAGALQTNSVQAGQQWRLDSRTLLNPASDAAPVYLIRLTPIEQSADWCAGDIAEIQLQDQGSLASTAIHRDYSIASLPSAKAIELLVRLVRYPDGRPGRVSGWLCLQAGIGSRVSLRVRSNPGFHLSEADKPLILIGAGTGLAGLRGHLLQRIALGQKNNWLLFGERHPQHDRLLQSELEALQHAGLLQRMNLCFSRAEHPRYVQQLITEHASELQAWVAQGASIMVCGRLAGMGQGVHQQLQTLLGEQQLESIRIQGRYRRDLY